MSDQREFSTGAVRDNADGKGRMDLLPWNAIIELSKHCERGAKHYGENNVRKGIPFHSLADSGARHLAKWTAGITDEPTHLVAACWNLMWLLEETLTRQELNDMPWDEIPQNRIRPEHPVDTEKVHEYDKDHLWWKGRQYISLNRVSEMKNEWLFGGRDIKNETDTEVDRYGRAIFHEICPYTGVECKKWTCNTCEISEAERGYMNEKEGEEE